MLHGEGGRELGSAGGRAPGKDLGHVPFPPPPPRPGFAQIGGHQCGCRVEGAQASGSRRQASDLPKSLAASLQGASLGCAQQSAPEGSPRELSGVLKGPDPVPSRGRSCPGC